jgi:UDP-N-acetylglucosamine 2-epimerase (non-hydrolysing)
MILISYGTRPEYIKIKPLIIEMSRQDIKYRLLFTGQHVNMGIDLPDYTLTIPETNGNRLDSIINGCMNIPDDIFNDVEYVLVQGDTTSVLGLALSAMHRGIKIIHLEAGLRSNDFKNPYPEEYNRRLVSSIADIHLCPTFDNKINLIKENISNDKIFVVGNTGLDNLIEYKNVPKVELNNILVTLHRRENHDTIDEWFLTINNLAIENSEYKFILPIHPNPSIAKYRHLLTNVTVVNQLKHEELIYLIINSEMVITDSGGIQEECSFFNKKCLVCRNVTERPEAIGITTKMIRNPWELLKSFGKALKPDCEWFNIDNQTSPFGDGYTSKKICEILKRL